MSLTNNLLAKALAKTIKSFEDGGKLSLSQSSTVFPLSTGLLSLDYFYNGGLAPRMYTFAGKEQSGKSLTASTVLASAYKQNVPMLIYFDAEETLSGSILKNLFEVDTFSDLTSSKKEGRVELPPRINIVRGNSLEGIMDAVTDLINALPDKVYLDDHKAWYYRLAKDDKRTKELIEDLNLEIDDKVSKQQNSGKFVYCKDNSSSEGRPGIQAILVIDSFAILLTDEDDEEGSSNVMANEARKFAKHIKRFVGRLERKQVAVLGINHTRENPGARFGNPEYEPGGSAIKFYASVQARVASISNSTAGEQDAEESIHDKEYQDKYQYKRLKFTKDKIAGNVTGNVKLRVWLRDCFGEARGFDLVYDTLEYLRATGQLEENRGRYVIKNHPILGERSLTYKQIKRLVLSTSIKDDRYAELNKEILEELKLDAPLDLRSWCFEQIRNREVFKNKTMLIDDLEAGEFKDEIASEVSKIEEI